MTVSELTPHRERFLSKVAETSSGCWEWIAHVTSNGYGQFGIGRRSVRYAHRVSYEMFVGPIPDGLSLDHLCRNTRCVNPAHLEPVTHRENVLRGIAPPARCAKKTHCLRGHQFTEDNTYRRPDGSRECIACRTWRRRQSRVGS